MTHLSCPSCGLHISLSGPGAEMEYCPRCLARARRVVRISRSESSTGAGRPVMCEHEPGGHG